jgi:hypothetical protein
MGGEVSGEMMDLIGKAEVVPGYDEIIGVTPALESVHVVVAVNQREDANAGIISEPHDDIQAETAPPVKAVPDQAVRSPIHTQVPALVRSIQFQPERLDIIEGMEMDNFHVPLLPQARL